MGTCPFSVSCRFASAHTNPDFSQLKNEPSADFKPTLNVHSMALQKSLRKHEYDFTLSEQVRQLNYVFEGIMLIPLLLKLYFAFLELH